MKSDERISIGRIMKGYCLDAKEIKTLIAAIGAEIEEGYVAKNKEQYTEERAVEIALNFMTSDTKDLYYITKRLYLICGLHPEDARLDYYELTARIINKRYEWKKQDLAYECTQIIISSIRDLSTVDKRKAIIHLYDKSFPLMQEVKGITHDLVARVIAERATDGESEDTATPSLPEFEICSRVASEGSGKTKVANTLKENSVAAKHVNHWKSMGLTEKDIAKKLEGKTSKTVIGILLFPNSPSAEAALQRLKRKLTEK